MPENISSHQQQQHFIYTRGSELAKVLAFDEQLNLQW